MVRSIGPKRRQPQGEHPTRTRLIEACVELLEDREPEEISLDALMDATGVTKGAIYHHFEDLSELIEIALVARFAAFVDANVASAAAMLAASTTRAEFLENLARLTAETQSPDRRAIRLRRARKITLASQNPRLAATLASEQERLTDALTELIVEAQQRGWFNRDFDARAGAVLVQAYTIGRIVDDISVNPVDPVAWEHLIARVIDKVFA